MNLLGEIVYRLFGVLCQLAFPNNEHVPARSFKSEDVLFVSFHIPIELRLPEFSVGFGNIGLGATGMLMPETTMDENHSSVFRQDDIRFSGKLFVPVAVNDEPESTPKER